MKLYLYAVAAIITYIAFNPLHAVDSVLKVRTTKYSIEIPFTDETTIAYIKSSICESEGIPVEQQQLSKAEWICPGLFLPNIEQIILEDHQTCAELGLKHEDTIYLYLQLQRRKTI